MAFPTTSVLEQFTGANGTSPPNSSWSNSISTSHGGIEIQTNQGETSHASNSYGSAWWNVGTFGPNSEAYLTISTYSGVTGSDDEAGVWLRIASPNTAGMDAYFIVYRTVNGGTDTCHVYRVDNGAFTQLGANISPVTDLAAGDKFGAEMNGSTITVYVYRSSAWSSLTTRSDGTYTGAGYIGCLNRRAASTLRIDDFGGGTISTGPLTLNLSDTLTLSDAIGKAIGLAKAESVTLTDSLAKAIRLTKAETFTLSDSLAKTVGLAKTETFTLSDSLAKGFGLAKAETFTLSDSLAKSVGLTKAESVTLTDSQAKSVGMAKAESVTLTDSLSRSWAAARSYSDTITLSDAAGKAVGITKSDIITLSDEIAKSTSLSKSDSITLMDSIVKSMGIAIEDSLTLSDTIFWGNALILSLDDTITVTDILVKGMGLSKEETISLVDDFIANKNGAFITEGGGRSRSIILGRFGIY